MEKKKPLSDIHVEDYLEEYAGREKTASDAFFTGGREKESLDGLWHYAADPYDTCLRQHWFEARGVNAAGFTLPLDFDFEGWPTMTLPCCWNTAAPEFFWYESTMVFTRRFRYLPKKAGERVFLRVGAANYALRVFLNGRYLGSHTGGSTPAFFELTEALQTENRILLTADASRRPRQVPPENTDWFNYGGVYRELELFRLPGTFIREFFVRLKPGSRDRLLVSLRLSDPAAGEAVFSLPEKGVEAALPVSGGAAEGEIPCPMIKLWTPEEPKLYDVALRFGEDRAEDRVGFREISTEGLQILLNGKPLFLRGVSCHEDTPERGKALTEEDCEQALLEAKALGCNFMRLAHYPHTEKMALLADRLGMLLWEEIPVYWAVRFSDGEVYAEAENQLSELILRDRNRASVIFWSVGNENADTDERFSFMSRLAAAARERDGSRLITAACMVSADNRIADRLAEVLDVIGLNEYFGWYSPDLRQLPELFARSRPEKPVIISEFGADALFGHHGTTEDKGTVECQAEVYRRQTEELSKIPCVRGMTPWILYDFRCPRRTHPLQGYYNRKGLVDADRRRRKPAWYVLRDFYEKKKAEE